MVTMSAGALMYVKVAVTGLKAGVVVNPTIDVVQMAFVAPDTSPGVGDWKAAVWEVNAASGQYDACCLVGPSGTVTLTPGTYDVWAKVIDNPEIPVIEGDKLVIE